MNPDETVLCISIGNSRSKYAIFLSDNAIFKGSLPTSDLCHQQIRSILRHKARRCILCSVVKGKDQIVRESLNSENITIDTVNHSMVTNIKNRYIPPDSIGIDRLLSGSYCYQISGKSVLLFDFGTATTATLINREGELIGGAIMPGIETQLLSLCSRTSLLPNVQPKGVKSFIADNTEDAILSGVIFSSASFVINYIEHSKKCCKTNNIRIFLTGGLSSYISPYLIKLSNNGIDYDIDEDISVKSLYNLYKMDQI